MALAVEFNKDRSFFEHSNNSSPKDVPSPRELSGNHEDAEHMSPMPSADMSGAEPPGGIECVAQVHMHETKPDGVTAAAPDSREPFTL